MDPLSVLAGIDLGVKGVTAGQAALAGIGLLGVASAGKTSVDNAKAEKEARMDHAIDVWLSTTAISARDHITNYRDDKQYQRDFDEYLRSRNLDPEEYRRRLSGR